MNREALIRVRECFALIFFLSSVLTGSTVSAENTKKQETQSVDPSTKAWDIIDKAWKGNVDNRRMIIAAASLGGARPKVYEYLDQAAEDKEFDVRLTACATLASLKDPRSIPPLKKLLADPTVEITFCAAQALFNMDDPSGKEVLLEVLTGKGKTGSSLISSEKRQALGTFKTKGRFFSTFFRMGIRFAPVPGLAMGFSSLEYLMKDKGANGRSLVALDFAKAKDPESLQALRDALKDKDEAVRAAAVHSIALRNDPSVRNDLIPLMDDKKNEVSYRAAVAYLRLDKVAEEEKAQAESQEASANEKVQKKKPSRKSHSQ